MAWRRRVVLNAILAGTVALAAAVPRPSHARQAPLNLSTPQPALFAGQTEDWCTHLQYTLIGQGYRRFRSPYQGANSLEPLVRPYVR